MCSFKWMQISYFRTHFLVHGKSMAMEIINPLVMYNGSSCEMNDRVYVYVNFLCVFGCFYTIMQYTRYTKMIVTLFTSL